MANQNVFAQIMSLGHRETFQRCVERYHGDAYIKTFSCRDQWLAMAFAQLTFRDSLRDLEAALNARPELLYQMGFRSRVARSTLADANEVRDWHIFADWAHLLGATRQQGSDLVITLDASDTITLKGLTLTAGQTNSFTAADVRFA